MLFLQVATAAGIGLAAYVIPAVISAVAAIGTGIGVAVSNKKNNEQMLDYNASMTQQSWERDDKYFQRSVADAEAAGLSPLAINGAMPNTAPLGAPQLNNTAPQFDINSLMQSISQYGQLEETRRHNKATEDATNTKLQNDAAKLKLDADKLQLEDKQLEASIKHQADLIELQSKQLAETSRKNASEYEIKRLGYVSEQIKLAVEQATGGRKIPTIPIHDRAEYETKFTLWTARNAEKVAALGLTSQAQGTAENSNTSLGANVNAAVAGGGLNGSHGSGESQYTVENQSQRIDYGMESFYISDPLPVFIPFDYDSGKSYYDF